MRGLSPQEMADMLVLLDELDARKRMTLAQNDFLAFVAQVDPAYKFGAHLKRLGSLLMGVESDAKDRIAVSMAPRFGKSQAISIYYPAWYLGKHPDHKVIVASHTADLAVDMARKVRNLMQTSEYRSIFPDVAIAADAKAAGKWNTNKGGEYYACGTGGALAGRGGHLIIVDDPLSEQDIKSGNTDSLDTTYEWFRSGLRTRLMPGGKLCVLHCLVGDTAVLQADGTEKALRDVRPGDMVASHDGGVFRAAKVLGWANQGLDRIYSVALKSGVIIRGNERHPLLVDLDGVEQWVTIKNLKPGMKLVCATSPDAASQCTPVENASTTTTKLVGKTQKVLALLNGVSGVASSALQRAVKTLHTLKGYAQLAGTEPATTNVKPRVLIIVRPSAATPTSKCSMGSLALTTTDCSQNKTVYAPYAESQRMTEIPRQHGKYAGWLLTTAMKLAKCVPSYATRATSLSKTATLPSYCGKPLSTLKTTLDEITSVTLDGFEDVFDIQVEGTENFVANGVVSHNTRWHMRDLIGRLVKDAAMNPDADQYEVFEFPAILNENTPYEKSLWPEQWSLESLLRTKASMPAWQWNAQYQQNPTAQESATIKKEWIRWWPGEKPPKVDFVVQSFDTALTTKERSDYSVCQTWGVWKSEEDGTDNVILLNRVKGKYEFPELKQMALEQYKDWEPDSVIVEAKASGQPLIDEMRRSGLFVQDFSPGKGQDKLARLNAVSDMFASGQVWFPETRWATEVVDEILAFPSGIHDDDVDGCTLALHRIRQGGLIKLRSDHDDEPMIRLPSRKEYY